MEEFWTHFVRILETCRKFLNTGIKNYLSKREKI